MNFAESKPRFARFTSSGEIVKDHHYYAGNEFSWNKSAVVSTKMYPFYHKLNDDNAKRVDGMSKVEHYEKELVNQLHRERVLKARDEGLIRHALKVKEREIIDRKCSESKLDPQAINIDDTPAGFDILDIVAKRANSFKHARSKDFSWNFLDKASDKQIKQIVIPKTLQGEEEMIKNIQKRYNKELGNKNKHDQERAEFRNKLRTELLNRHEKAYDLEERIGTMSVKNKKQTTRREVIEHPLETNSGFSSVEAGRSSLDSSFERISLRPTEMRRRFQTHLIGSDRRPSQISFAPLSYKQASIANVEEPNLKKVLELVQGDLRGTLVKNMDKGTFDSKNVLHSKLAASSRIFQDLAEENKKDRSTLQSSTLERLEEANSRTSNTVGLSSESREKLPSINSKSLTQSRSRTNNEHKETMLDINSFERTFNSTLKGNIYGRAVLEQANLMCKNIGVVSPKEFLKMKTGEC